MRIPFILYIYFAKKFILNFFLVLLVFFLIVFVFDLLEILRSTFNHNISITVILKITFLKMPYLLSKLLPFTILIASTLTLHNLNKYNELVVARGCGISAWSFITPICLVSFIIGIFAVTVFNPFVSSTLKKNIQLEEQKINNNVNVISISDAGIWLKDLGTDNKTQKIIYAKGLYDRGRYLSEVSIFLQTEQNDFSERIEADMARIEDNKIIMNDTKIFKPGQFVLTEKNLIIPTNVKPDQLERSLAIPELVSLWDLSDFIRKIEISGFSAQKYRFHFYSLIITPFFFVSLILVSTIFSLTLPRNGKQGIMFLVSIVIGFAAYLISKVTYTLALFGSINLILAVIIPVQLCFVIGLILIFHYEDG